ncbi:hypothetical protein [Nonomuraea sp. CA-141351]|uniref:hypothetical protein n=1 Tax=Nonomuraea sp. CA-141351 TaxID=3239996 RepID=UPI003D9107E3
MRLSLVAVGALLVLSFSAGAVPASSAVSSSADAALASAAAGPPTSCAGDRAVAAPMRWSQWRSACELDLRGKLTYRWSADSRVCVQVRSIYHGESRRVSAPKCGKKGVITVSWSGKNPKDVRKPKLRAYSSSDTRTAVTQWSASFTR